MAALGLVFLLSRLRDVIGGVGDDESGMQNSFWGLRLASAVCMAAGWAVAFSIPIAYAFAGGGGFTLTSSQTYATIEVGDILVYGPGGIFLGSALIVLFLDGRAALPVWLRWVTLIAGVLGLASPAFFPWFALLIWGVVIGIWLLMSGRASA